MDHMSFDPPADSTTGPAAPTRVRDSLLLVAALKVPALADPVQVRVRNLSPGGMMAEYAGPIATGDSVKADLRGIGRVAGKVAWVAEGRIGVAFDAEIDPKLARKPVTVKTAATPPRRITPL